MTIDNRPGVAVLEAHTCLSLLRGADVGRLALAVDGRPEIFPVNYLVDHGTILFRTGAGTKFAGIIAGRYVAFEVDGYQPEAGEAWSVVVKGRAEEITILTEVLDAMTFPLFPWHAGLKPHFVRIVPDDISGRRFRVLDSSAQRTPMTDAHRSAAE